MFATNSPDSVTHITVCVCTFKRPQLLLRLLDKLAAQDTGGRFTYSVVVTDNDREQSARVVVDAFARGAAIDVRYCVEAEQNIARARNRALANARGDFVAFIDDDEYPTSRWLLLLLQTCAAANADGVLGPVKPDFEVEPPAWIVQGRMFERPRHPTGHAIGMADARTGNVLLRRAVVTGEPEPFDTRFGTGGEDVDFFRRLMDQGRRFVWCDEAVVFETVPAARCTRSYLLRRALLRGRDSSRQRAGHAGKLLASSIALPAFTVALPFMLVAGEQHFMKYLAKWCYHAGRVLASVGLSPVTRRDA
jgi:succinoglycan biosynthesis protein ExoM